MDQCFVLFDMASQEYALLLVVELCFRLIFLPICEGKRDLNHYVCNCIYVFHSRQMDKSNMFRNVCVINNLNEVVIAN